MNQLSSSREQQIRDTEHLRALSICHYVLGGLTALYSSLFLIHFGLGLMMLLHPEFMRGPNGVGPPAFFGFVFAGIGGVAVLGGWTLGALEIYSGRLLQQRRRRLFSQVVSGLSCMSMPLGTILGIFTLTVLSRPSVKALYEQPADSLSTPALPGPVSEPDEHVWHELEKRASEQQEG